MEFKKLLLCCRFFRLLSSRLAVLVRPGRWLMMRFRSWSTEKSDAVESLDELCCSILGITSSYWTGVKSFFYKAKTSLNTTRKDFKLQLNCHLGRRNFTKLLYSHKWITRPTRGRQLLIRKNLLFPNPKFRVRLVCNLWKSANYRRRNRLRLPVTLWQ
jgi:hypothetical protein